MYDFSISGLIKAAYERTQGVKWIFLAALAAYIVMAVIVSAIIGVIFPGADKNALGVNLLTDQVHSLLSMPILVPVLTGILMLGISHARDSINTLSSIFNFYVKVWPLVFASIAMHVLVIIGLMLLIVPGIYLAIAYAFTLPLIVDKGLGVWEAMELSRKTVTKRWFKFFGLDIALFALIFLSAIPFGIGLVWTLPLAYITYGLLYHRLFDDEELMQEHLPSDVPQDLE